MSSFRDDSYQYTRAIRFKLDPQRQSQDFKDKWQFNESQTSLPELANFLKTIHGKLRDLFFIPKTDDDKNKNSQDDKWTENLSISKNWLKDWHKNIFHASIKNTQNRDGKYKLQDLKPIHENLKNWLGGWKEKVEQLESYSKKPKESKMRHSDIAYLVRWFLNRQQLSYIQDFLKEIHVPYTNLDDKIEHLRNNTQKLQENLKTAEKYYQSSQSSGIEISKSSFNYYTVNKKSKDYYEDKLIKLEKEICENRFTIIKNNHWHFWNNQRDFNQRNEIFFFKSDLEKEWIEKYIDEYNKDEINKHKINSNLQKDGVGLSLDQTYHAMKTFKAEQKSIFYELMKCITSNKKGESSYEIRNSNYLNGYEINYEQHNLQGINRTFSLFQFKDKEKYNDFLKLTQNLEKEQDSQKKKDIAKERGNKFLFGKKCYFSEYWNFCECYKKIAQKRGQLIAQIKGIEKEKEEAINTDYWSLIYVEGEHKQLWLIPKNKMQNAKRFIYQNDNNKDEKGTSNYLCCFESLTIRALHKLCFAEESSFVEAMLDDLKKLRTKIKAINKKSRNNLEKFQTPEQKRERKKKEELKFFKKILEWQKELPEKDKRKTLQLDNFKKLKEVYKTQSFEEFEKALEEACYYVKKIPLTRNEREQFLKDHDVTVLDITSYDLQSRNKNTHQTPESENRLHTDLWQEFWKNLSKENKKVRLNPEVKIRYRKADEDLKSYLEKLGFDEKFKKDKTFTQRGIQDQFTASLTLALNAGNKYEDLAFAKPEELCEKINDFNEQQINKQKDFKTAWKYGIDRGQIELATLCLAKFDPEKTYQINNKAIPKPKFAPIKCYTLEDYKHQVPFDDGKKRDKTHRRAIDNLSYFIDKINDKNLFKPEKTSCLDLTTAKVIKGKIVTNGDVMTYLKFKKVSAKRKLYEFYAKNQINSNVQLKWSEYEHGKDGADGKKSHYRPEGVLNINIKIDKGDSETTIYDYCDKYKDIISKKCIEEDLNRYLEELKCNDEKHTPSILQINHLRDAITANTVGVIVHLYREYPGFIILEDLDKGKTKENDNIHNRLEVALYNKFQSLGLVPPHVKDIIQLKEEVKKAIDIEKIREEIQRIDKRLKKPEFLKNAPRTKIDEQKRELKLLKDKEVQYSKSVSVMRSSQIGAIVFVDERDTSQICPYCEKTQASKENKEDKFQDKQFKCPDCSFNTNDLKQKSYDEKFQFLKDIDDPDKVAAYNIAKKLKSNEEIGKWKLPPPIQNKEETYKSRDEKSRKSKDHQNNGQRRDNRSKKQGHKNRHNDNRFKNHNENHTRQQKLTHQPFKKLNHLMKQGKQTKRKSNEA